MSKQAAVWLRSGFVVLMVGSVWAADLPSGWSQAPGCDKAPGQAGYCIRHAVSGLELVYVPGGTFTMGSDAQDVAYARERLGATRDMLADEQPAHDVTLAGYWIGRTEVTVGQWRCVMGSVPKSPTRGISNDQGDHYPVVGVNYDDMRQFCAKLGVRLPTEAEWEYAARGPAQLRFPWGNEWDPARCCGGSNPGPHGSTRPVGTLPANVSWCGAYDLAGNVWELCADWYAEDYYARSPRENPLGATEAEATKVRILVATDRWLDIGKCRVAKGGSWRHDFRSNYRASFRRPQPPGARTDYLGFRVALSQ